MEEGKHTPGPWFHERGYIFGADGFEVATVEEGRCLPAKYLLDTSGKYRGPSDVECKDREDAEEMEANGDVMAAAPELLAALKTLASYLGVPSDGWFGIKDDDAIDLHLRVRAGDIKAALAAIAKANGEART